MCSKKLLGSCGPQFNSCTFECVFSESVRLKIKDNISRRVFTVNSNISLLLSQPSSPAWIQARLHTCRAEFTSSSELICLALFEEMLHDRLSPASPVEVGHFAGRSGPRDE